MNKTIEVDVLDIYHPCKSAGRKGHSNFVLKWNRILNFFNFSFSLSNRKTIFKSQILILILIFI